MKFSTIYLFILLSAFALLAKDNILIIRSDGDAFKEVASSITENLQNEFNISDTIIGKDVWGAKKTAKLVNEVNPKLVILMNVQALKSYKKYQASLKDTTNIIPSISLMTALLPSQIKGLKNATGITYEVPIVTSVVNLRSLLKIDTVKLGVVYREFLKPFIAENEKYCKQEGITLIKGYVPKNNKNYEILLKKGLDYFVSPKIGVNMIWVPNDPAFLTPSIIKDVWIPFTETHKIPIIVGVESLLSSKVNFGTYAVLPDHSALGQQAADMVLDIMDNNWKASSDLVEPPISIYQVLNTKTIKGKYNIKKDNIEEVDKVLE